MQYNYDAYDRSDNGGKQFIMRQVFRQIAWQQETIERLAREMDELKHKALRMQIKDGVIEQFHRAQRETMG